MFFIYFILIVCFISYWLLLMIHVHPYEYTVLDIILFW